MRIGIPPSPPPKTRMAPCRALVPLPVPLIPGEALDGALGEAMMQRDQWRWISFDAPGWDPGDEGALHRYGAPDQGTRTVLAATRKAYTQAISLLDGYIGTRQDAARTVPYSIALTSARRPRNPGASPPRTRRRFVPRGPAPRPASSTGSGIGVPDLPQRRAVQLVEVRRGHPRRGSPYLAARHPCRRRHPTLLED